MICLRLEDDMALFHCTTEVYSPGAVIGPHAKSHFSEKQQNRGYGWVERLLSQHRTPAQPHGRENAVYASDSAENAAIFLEGEYRSAASKPAFYCYEVEATPISKAPMALVGLLELAKADPDRACKIAHEYWEPKSNWRYWEYFAPMMTVVRVIKWPSEGDTARVQYSADRELGKRLWDLKVQIPLVPSA
jgi:hypothetical protein